MASLLPEGAVNTGFPFFLTACLLFVLLMLPAFSFLGNNETESSSSGSEEEVVQAARRADRSPFALSRYGGHC